MLLIRAFPTVAMPVIVVVCFIKVVDVCLLFVWLCCHGVDYVVSFVMPCVFLVGVCI